MEILASEIVGDLDRLSHLPESIVHTILDYIHPSRGPPVDHVRMSVLSKTWFDLTASFPVLNFNIRIFTSRQSFFKYVEYTTSRFCHQNVTADKLTFIATLSEPAEIDIVNQCFELLLKKGVKELFVDITHLPESPNPMPKPKYRLPDILLSVSALKYLDILYCDLPSSLMVHGVKFESLIKLKLFKVHIDDETIKYLATSCPLLQVFHIMSCYGFKSFCVYGHQNLQHVVIKYSTQVDRIDIEAPNLSHLWVQDVDDNVAPRMNLASCKKLTTVTYDGYYLPNDFLSNFPFIEILHLATDHDTCDNLKWSSHSLRALVIDFDCDLEQIDFNTPNLVFFIYGSFSCTTANECWSLLRDSTHLKACMRCYPDECIDAIWFQKLRLFLEKKNGIKPLNLYIQMDQDFTDLEEINAIELPPYELEHVELQLDAHEELSPHMAFVDAVLWCCRPQYLTIKSFFPLTDFEDVVKIVCEKLLQQEVQGHTNIRIVSSHDGNTISFIKKEGIQEQAG
ncbi:hypothetical protein SSX86_033183 [Deinandra increscens subsp. villosa]|uniref:F-box/LRR-repeat protein 15/At3g58940/PEG3-like LRR domain-containing protein n=1 Tax=Deinandra increscens subsp. villosa TaxID=3103831 RepID=A0AAP0C5H0_9ASTR